MKVVEVVWTDACFEDEYGVQDAKQMDPIEMRTVGYVTSRNKKRIVLAMSYVPKQPDVVTEQMVIPAAMIVRVRKLGS